MEKPPLTAAWSSNSPRQLLAEDHHSESKRGVRRRKLEMLGCVFGKHAPVNANKLITLTAAIIDSLLVCGLFR